MREYSKEWAKEWYAENFGQLAEYRTLVPFIKWYSGDACIVRGHGLGEDAMYLCGDKPARYPLPTLTGRVFFTRWVVCLFTTDPYARDYICEKRWDSDA